MKNLAHRIVHFDLKGAPWKVPFLKDVMVHAKQWGATGVLFEWEDSFPYKGRLITIGSLGGSSRDGLYSEDEVKQLLQFSVEIGLEPIQLVQSFGHLEFVLKHEEFAHMREIRAYPAVLCPTRPGGKELVIAMIKQLLAKQPDAKFVHIGADEAWYVNRCAECIMKTSDGNFNSDTLFLTHIKDIVTEVRKFYPQVKVLIWDDMLRKIEDELLIEGGMSNYVIPVVWHYAPEGSFSLNASMWQKYEKCFFELWVASAFKGAINSCQMLSPVEHYVSNQNAWINQIGQLHGRGMLITGLILTGWSRFDHYATLCELLPVSLPSLAGCLKVWCDLDPESAKYAADAQAAAPAGAGAGAGAARGVREWHACRERCRAFLHGDAVSTWLNPWQIAHSYTTAMQVMGISHHAKLLVQEVNVLHEELRSQLHALTGPRSAEEWLLSNVEPLAGQLRRLAARAAERALLPASVVPAVINNTREEES